MSGAGLTEVETYSRIFNSGLEAQYDRGLLTTDEFLAALRAQLSLAANDEQIADAWSDIFSPNEAVIAALPELHLRHRLVLASNTNELHARQFRRRFPEALTHFDALVLSHEVGFRKPDGEFFARCVEAAGCAASQCLFIDDKPEFVEAARKLGLQGLVYTPTIDLLTATL